MRFPREDRDIRRKIGRSGGGVQALVSGTARAKEGGIEMLRSGGGYGEEQRPEAELPEVESGEGGDEDSEKVGRPREMI